MSEELDLHLLKKIAHEHRLAGVALFGSRASGAARPDSDIDLAVLHEDERPLTFRELGALQLALSEWAGLRADVADLGEADALLRFEALSHGRVLLRTSPQWENLVARTIIEHDEIAPFLDLLVAGVGRAARRRDDA